MLVLRLFQDTPLEREKLPNADSDTGPGIPAAAKLAIVLRDGLQR